MEDLLNWQRRKLRGVFLTHTPKHRLCAFTLLSNFLNMIFFTTTMSFLVYRRLHRGACPVAWLKVVTLRIIK